MKLREYGKDHLVPIAAYLFTMCFILFLLNSLQLNDFLIFYTFLLLFFLGIFLFLYDFFRKKQYFDQLIHLINQLDQKYFIQEILREPSFLEGKIFQDALYQIDKCMIEKLNEYKFREQEFKEYIELWVHEMKTPLSSCKLIVENHPSPEMDRIDGELDQLNDDIEQVLYYARSEHVEKDYLIKKISLQRIVHQILKDQRKVLIEKKIQLELRDLDREVNTDRKWLEFIIKQILANCLRYVPKDNGKIKIYTEIVDQTLHLVIEDNGIGIPSNELSRVFEKGFTGTNGRKYKNTTGMGLYLCKKLCEKLGHSIMITSEEGKYTQLCIIFSMNAITEIMNK